MRRAIPYWYSGWRRFLIRIALGKRTFDYMLMTLNADKRIHGARMVDIVVRQDAVEKRIEADWVKTIKRICVYRPKPTRAQLKLARAQAGSKQACTQEQAQRSA